jgi:hypothetical protein
MVAVMTTTVTGMVMSGRLDSLRQTYFWNSSAALAIARAQGGVVWNQPWEALTQEYPTE